MPIAVLFWILVGLPVIGLLCLGLAWWRDRSDELGELLIQTLMMCSFVTILTAPNLLWYKSVRDVMFVLPDVEPRVEQSVEKPEAANVEVPVELIANPALMVQ